MNAKFIRHGDVLIEKVDEIPSGLKQKPDLVLLEGEATGHYHRLSAGNVVLAPEPPTVDNNYNLGFFELESEASLTHEEHKTIKLAPGKYKFYSQREFDPLGERRVID